MILSSVVMVLFWIAIIGTFTPDYKVHHLAIIAIQMITMMMIDRIDYHNDNLWGQSPSIKIQRRRNWLDPLRS